MPFHRLPGLYPPARPLVEAREVDALVSWMTHVVAGTPTMETDLLARHAARLDAASRDLELMCLRAGVAVGQWALPTVVSGCALGDFNIPEGASPIRVIGVLLEMGVRGELPDPEAALDWSTRLQGRANTRWFALHHDDGLAALNMIRFVCPAHWATRDEPVVMSVWGSDSRRFVRHLTGVIEPAMGIRTYGPLASDNVGGIAAETQAEARAIVTDVFRRHQAGAEFPVPAITEADVLMLSLSPESSGRALAVTLAPRIVQAPRRRGRRV